MSLRHHVDFFVGLEDDEVGLQRVPHRLMMVRIRREGFAHLPVFHVVEGERLMLGDFQKSYLHVFVSSVDFLGFYCVKSKIGVFGPTRTSP